MSTNKTEAKAILTDGQREVIKERADDARAWRDDADLARRRHIATEVRETVFRSGILEGKTLDSKTLCELVSLQWQIQNLNAMQMPRLLGLYHYKVHFRDFEGTVDDLRTMREEETGDPAMYEGADLVTVSESLRLIDSDKTDNHYLGAKKLLSEPGAGEALVSGFLHLLHPEKYALINAASTAAFSKNGWLEVTTEQRKEARQSALASYSTVANSQDKVLGQIFRYQVFLHEVLSTCGFADFHVVDQFVWTLEGGDRKDPQSLLEPILKTLGEEKENVRVRAEAEQRARQLIENYVGNLSADQFRELFELINTCVGKKGVVYTRFSPAFVGQNANLIIARAADLNQWISKLWTASDDDLRKVLDQFWELKIAGGGRSLPTAILYLRDKERFAVWTSNLERALYSIVSGLPAKIRTGFSYLQYCERLQRLRKLTGFAPELHDWILFKVLTSKFTSLKTAVKKSSGEFAGFTPDTFGFMSDLAANNNQSWFQSNKDRFRNSVDLPLRALVKDLGEQVMTALDPGLETAAKSTKCISRIRKNVYGAQEEDVYRELYWAAFYRKERTKQTDCQFFMSIRPAKFHHGIFFGEHTDDMRASLVESMEAHPGLAGKVFAQIKKQEFLFADSESSDSPEPVEIATYDEFLDLVRNHRFHIFRRLAPEEAVATGAALNKKIGDDFRTLYAVFLLATSANPEVDVPPYVREQDEESDVDSDGDDDQTTIADLAAATYMEEEFFTKLDKYLEDKQQLIFFGPPGTGKTFVALQYAEYRTQDKSKVRTVQFHPSYGYEDFMEGLRPVTQNGQLVYQVEAGVFKKLCDDARADMKSTYVLLIDEINRGNLPRILGELLFLLERREETAELPYSKKPFSIPRNVIILGTMNSSDRSIALMDLALRRRFHFVTMEPRREVLRAWLQEKEKPLWIGGLFDRLNETLRSESIDDDHLVGHAHFMSPHLDEEQLELIWEGTIEPMLREYFFTEPEKLAKFRLDTFWPGGAESEAGVADITNDSDDEMEDGDAPVSENGVEE